MCNDCTALEKDKITVRKTRYGLLHCRTGPAYINNMSDVPIIHWYINGKVIFKDDGHIVSTQEEFEKTSEYREWNLRAFS